jgi:hypothetical protein
MIINNLSPEQIGEKISALRNDITQIARALCMIEAHQPLDNRSFTLQDLLDAVDMTKQVIESRLEEGMYKEWKNDHKQEYAALFNSISTQVSETLSLHFKNEDGKSLRFVHSFNILIVRRLFIMFRLLGPSSTHSLAPALLDEIKQTILEVESVDPIDLQVGQAVLNNFRKAPAQPIISKSAREQMIRKICESRKEEAA